MKSQPHPCSWTDRTKPLFVGVHAWGCTTRRSIVASPPTCRFQHVRRAAVSMIAAASHHPSLLKLLSSSTEGSDSAFQTLLPLHTTTTADPDMLVS